MISLSFCQKSTISFQISEWIRFYVNENGRYLSKIFIREQRNDGSICGRTKPIQSTESNFALDRDGFCSKYISFKKGKYTFRQRTDSSTSFRSLCGSQSMNGWSDRMTEEMVRYHAGVKNPCLRDRCSLESGINSKKSVP